MKSIINKKSLIFILIVLTIGVIVYRFVQRSQVSEAPKNPTITSTQPDSQLNIKTYKYIGGAFSPPKTLDVFSSQPTVSSQDLVQTMATALDLQASDKPGLWVNQATNESLSVSSMDKSIAYVHELQPNTVVFTEALVSASLDANTQFLQKVGYTADLIPDKKNISYYAQAYELIPATQTTSNVAVVPYTVFINDIPVFFENTTYPPALLWVDSTQRILKGEFYSMPPTMSPLTTSSTYSTSEALENMKNGKAVVISTQLIQEPIDIDQIVSANFENVSIEYRYTEADRMYFPYYRFSGTGRTAQGATLGIDIITPAVK